MTNYTLNMSILGLIDYRERSYLARIAELEAEVQEWKDRWWESVDSSIRHNDAMMAGMVELAIKGVKRGEA